MKLVAFPGGGCLGAFQAAVLQQLAPDEIARAGAACGTSIGSFSAVSVGLRKTENILPTFLKFCDGVFGGYPWRHYIKWPLPRYGDAPLNAALHDHFGDSLFGECKIPVWVVAAHASGRPKIFSSLDTADGAWRAWEVVRASCAAPTYFSRWRGKSDGGVVANHPVLIGIAGLVHDVGHSLDQISACKIGTGYARRIDEDANDLATSTPRTWTGNLIYVMRAHFEGAVDEAPDNVAGAVLGRRYVQGCDFPAPDDMEMDDPRVPARILQNYGAEISRGADLVRMFLGS